MSGEPANAPEADLCVVPGCGAPAVRHLALAEARQAFEELPEHGRRAPLCREHYRAWKKATRERRALDRLGR
ncbi:MAG TPA: hypothetical protein VMH49_05375 [Thermoplasmata archaeon]|nr:hypothetical protein [Thermoplasmata archaeon]